MNDFPRLQTTTGAGDEKWVGPETNICKPTNKSEEHPWLIYYLVVNEQVSQSLDSDGVYAALEIGQGAQLFRIYSSTSEPVQCLTRMLPGHHLSEVFGVQDTLGGLYLFVGLGIPLWYNPLEQFRKAAMDDGLIKGVSF